LDGKAACPVPNIVMRIRTRLRRKRTDSKESQISRWTAPGGLFPLHCLIMVPMFLLSQFRHWTKLYCVCANVVAAGMLVGACRATSRLETAFPTTLFHLSCYISRGEPASHGPSLCAIRCDGCGNVTGEELAYGSEARRICPGGLLVTDHYS
jgi:hypothetical protein